MRQIKASLIVLLLIAGLLLPKVSVLALHLNPNIMATVICTGTELVTIHIGPDGQPVETIEADHSSCLLADPNAVANRTYVQWTRAESSYRTTLVENAISVRTQAEVGLLSDLRGPPSFVI